MVNDPTIALHRFGLGAKPGQLHGMTADIRGALKEALRKESALLESNGLQSTSANLATLHQFQAERRQHAKDPVNGQSVTGKMNRTKSPIQTIYVAEIDARLTRFRKVETGLLERLTLFWANHFTISARKMRVRAMAGSYEREAIRPNVTGRFAELLRAVISHPAMLVYLDNDRSVGPNSRLGRRRDRGLNENLARELLELHTVGIDSGYSQRDVVETAKILTGWSLQGAQPKKGRPSLSIQAENEPFTFTYFENRHEPGAKSVLGERYEEAGQDEAIMLLDALASHPATARHIATKLARYFVADDPPAELVDALESSFNDGDGDLLKVYDTLLDHPLAWSVESKKLRTPQEWLAAALRAFEADMPAQFANRSLVVMGHPFWSPPSPKGYEDRAEAWLGGAMISARLDWAAAFTSRYATAGEPLALAEHVLGTQLTDETALAMRRAATRKQAFEIMLLAPEMMRR